MFITSGKAGKSDSAVGKAWAFTKSYLSHVASAYLSFAGALALLVVASEAMNTEDSETFGLGWLHLTALKDDRVREEKFPAHAPHTTAQRRRTAAANAVEYAAETV